MKILNLGCGRKYIEGAVNVDLESSSVKADRYVDLSVTELFGEWLNEENSYDRIIAHHLLEHVRDLPTLMTNCMLLLKEGGEMDIQVPYDLSYGAWQDPTHVRALNERSWIYYDEWSWYLESYSKEWLQWSLKIKESKLIPSHYGISLLERNGLSALGVPIAAMPRAIDEMHVILTKTKKEN